MESMTEKEIIRAQALIFDMDGVITNTMPYHYQAWNQAFQEICGRQLDETDVYLREGSKGSFALSEIFDQYGWDYDMELLDKVLARKEEIFSAVVKMEFIDGAEDFLKEISCLGFQMALVTGTSRDELNRMLSADIQSYFSVSVTGSDVTSGKPEPEPYLSAVRQLNISPEDVCVLENAPLGIRSAKAAGLRCLALETSLSKKFLTEADFIFHSYTDMMEKIEFRYSGRDA